MDNLNPLTPTQSQLDAQKKAIDRIAPTNTFANTIDQLATFLRLPEIGFSEALAGGENTTNTANPAGVDLTGGVYNSTPTPALKFKGSTTYNPEVLGYNSELEQQAQQALNKANEVASYDDQISNLDRLLGYAATKRQQGIQGIEDQYASTEAAQKKAFDTQRLQNTQNQEKGYGEVGTFANTSLNNLNRLLQGSNAGRSSVGQVLAPYMVNRSADTRRRAVTETAGENARNIDITSDDTFKSLFNQKNKNLQDYEASVMSGQNELDAQKRQAVINRGLASGQGYEQARAGAADITSSMNDRYTQLADLFSKYKPDYTVKEAPALSTYQVDPAQVKTQSQGTNDFYLNMLKRKKDLKQGV